MAKAPTPIRAAGVVLLRDTTAGPQVCVLHRPRQNDWSLPKGKLDAGEIAVEAARRETIEETGSDVVLGVPLSTQRYQVETRPKTVEYWVGRESPGGPGFAPNKEIDEIRWLPPEPAIAMLSYPRDGDLVRQALAAPVTSPFIILRHTEAMRRADYDGVADAERPLTQSGTQAADRLSYVLQAFGVRKVHSSDSLRCLDTVRPFAHQTHAPLEHETLLSEEGFVASRTAAFKRVDSLLDLPMGMVICTHRPVLPELIAHVAARLAVTDIPDGALAPGAALVFHRTPGATVVEHVPAP
ncbi:MAG: NUDIX hydrolase [Candidatus Nanopelagicales bacterium]|jgi:8-oxo-dGTP diphosphatase|nr:NUDIX hydrolase [Candidatus Nanopelagicales bacterium]MCU0297539.1 NUDIX hydrolase [Candidatus Nanopelagicales bacterium]